MVKLYEEVSEALDAGTFPDFCGDRVEDFIARLSTEGPGPRLPSTLESDEAFRGRAENSLRQLALVELWLGGTQLRLEEVKKQLDERERAASERAFAHVPDLEADPRSVFLKFA